MYIYTYIHKHVDRYGYEGICICIYVYTDVDMTLGIDIDIDIDIDMDRDRYRYTSTPNVALFKVALWSLFDGTWGNLKGSWAVLDAVEQHKIVLLAGDFRHLPSGIGGGCVSRCAAGLVCRDSLSPSHQGVV